MGRRNTFVQVSTVPREEMSNFSNRKSCCIDFRGSSPFTLHPDNRPDRGIYDKYTGRTRSSPRLSRRSHPSLVRTAFVPVPYRLFKRYGLIRPHDRIKTTYRDMPLPPRPLLPIESNDRRIPSWIDVSRDGRLWPNSQSGQLCAIKINRWPFLFMRGEYYG